MPGERFLDTNVLIYAFARGDPRNARAEELLVEGGVIGIQVLNEFTTSRRRWPWSRHLSGRRGRSPRKFIVTRSPWRASTCFLFGMR